MAKHTYGPTKKFHSQKLNDLWRECTACGDSTIAGTEEYAVLFSDCPGKQTATAKHASKYHGGQDA